MLWHIRTRDGRHLILLIWVCVAWLAEAWAQGTEEVLFLQEGF